jgi:hypothetical protein
VSQPSWSLLFLQLPILVYRYGGAFLNGLAGGRWASRVVAFYTCELIALYTNG